MEIIAQIAVFFGICLAGEALEGLLPIPIPASILGMGMLFLLLYFKVLKPKQIQQKSDFLLRNMAFFFIPAGVGIVEKYSIIQNSILPLLFICLITTVLTFFVSVFTVKWVIRLQNRRNEEMGGENG